MAQTKSSLSISTHKMDAVSSLKSENKVDEMLIGNIINSVKNASGNNWKKEWNISSVPVNGISGNKYNLKTMLLLLFVQGRLEKQGTVGNRWFTIGQVKKFNLWPERDARNFKPVKILAYSESPFFTIKYLENIDGKEKLVSAVGKKGKKIFFPSEINEMVNNLIAKGITSDKIHVSCCGCKIVPLYHESQLNQIEIAKLPKFEIQKTLNCDLLFINKIVEAIKLNNSITFSDSQSLGKCYYDYVKDGIFLPSKESFDSAEALYATAFHEIIHSTGHESRLNRDIKNIFGSEKYAKEELVAELGSILLGNQFGYDSSVEMENHAEYIKNWLNSFAKQDELEKEVRYAINKAIKAVGFIQKQLPA